MPFTLTQVYIDANKTIADGRKIPKQFCVAHPQMRELQDVLDHLGFEYAYEDNKSYPRDITQFGRFRVLLKDPISGEPKVEGITSRRRLLEEMGKHIPKLKSRVEGKCPTPGTPGIPFPGYPETLMPIAIAAPGDAAGAAAASSGGGSSKKKGKGSK